MRQTAGLVNLLPTIPVLLAHLTGVVVAIVLLFRQEKRAMPAVLALVGFGLLVGLDVANIARGPLIRFLTDRTTARVRLVIAGVGCCCSVFDVAAVACLAIAIWQALSRASAEGAG